MGTLLTRIFVGAVLCGVAFAQQTSVPPNTATQSPQSSATQPAHAGSEQAAGTLKIAPGSVIPAQLTRTVDAKKVKTGDPVEAKVTQDLKAKSGEVVVPKDTKVIGHVTEAQPRTKEQKESELGIAFDHAAIRNGSEVPLPMSIQAIIAPAALNPGNNNGGEGTGQAPSTPSPGGMSPNSTPGRPAGMGGSTPSSTPSSPASENWPTNPQDGSNAHQPITGNTQGVVGMSNLKLSAAANATEGSVVSSEKNNVKLDSGTLILLRVNPEAAGQK